MDRGTYAVRLKPGAAVFCDGNGYGLRMGGYSRYAGNAAQMVILKALERKHCTLDEHLIEVASNLPEKTLPCMASLMLTEFLLDFEAFLEK